MSTGASASTWSRILASGGVGHRRDLELQRRARDRKSPTPLVSTLEAIRLLEDRIAEALQIAGRFHHLDERALDSSRQHLLVDLLSAERAASRFDRLRLDEAFRFAHQRCTRQRRARSEDTSAFHAANASCRTPACSAP